jgi:ERCC4-type nuclease
MRDEAHRFGITFHRAKRNKNTLLSELEEIESIGQTSSEKLLKKFKSVKKIAALPLEELETLLTKKQALKVFEFFHSEQISVNTPSENVDDSETPTRNSLNTESSGLHSSIQENLEDDQEYEGI